MPPTTSKPAHPCAAAGCARYRKAKLPDRIMHWCNILHTPMALCFNLLPSAGAQQGQDRTDGAFCARPKKGRAS
jgi:hypothetical protein